MENQGRKKKRKNSIWNKREENNCQWGFQKRWFILEGWTIKRWIRYFGLG